MSKIHCGKINPNKLKIAGKPNRVMTPEVKSASIWTDRKNDYRRHKERQKIRHYSDEYGNGGFFVVCGRLAEVVFISQAASKIKHENCLRGFPD